jgi:hypothetical protein
MSCRVEDELALLRRHWPTLEYLATDHWVWLPSYPVPSGWTSSDVEVSFRIPGDTAVQPYGFYVRPGLLVAGTPAAEPANYTNPAAVPFGVGWAMFSWAPATPWRPHEQIERGDNMTHFVRSFRDRFEILG